MFEASWIALGIGFVLMLYTYQIKKRRKMMFFKFLSDVFMAVYFFMVGGFSGSAGAMIAGTGALVQALTPDQVFKKTLPWRILFAFALSCAGVVFLARNVSDFYPFMAVVGARVVELFHSTLVIRSGFVACNIAWITYNYLNEYYLMLWVMVINTVFMVVGILRHETNLFSKTL